MTAHILWNEKSCAVIDRAYSSFLRVFAEWAFDGADIVEEPVDGRHGESGLNHHLTQQRRRFRMGIGRLHADADESVGIIDGLPAAMSGQVHDMRIPAAFVACLEPGAAVH